MTAPVLLRLIDLGLGPLRGLNAALPPGLSAITGGEGCGKTLLLRLLAGELAPAQGRIERQQGPVWYAPTDDPADDAVVAADWLAARRPHHARWDQALADNLADALDLAQHLPKPLYMLSRGSRRKLGLLGAAASGAELVLLDQPWAALDARSCRLVDELLTEAADSPRSAWVVADYALPPALADLPLAAHIALGD
ncbi:ATP-binding cassette domain-containing protein [Ideonella sp. 4Y11]|uniref:ATP-binding cassette domain-containing protein n=1 Tax=Ideonella aquatica TaxID=2824119 RepID=A0A940YL18_9BURK|nr:ATP-binding cassette domain-containing protein [Ideonella aquatica]MBQ0959809.1 ATP-binding cassette domain-containing protein [Ideonella aquatica]